ncbi:MAG: sspH [Paenibacillus sp.]|jgi:small acid-soluble spore protein H (minor)|nr:sspH [Paenibacillus sp.]MDQ0903137.1 small acid-soluble spore protein H (minor) [Paenibacillus sp. V4I7]MDQ0918387.1 small acid-soluble spore protein H (minor) [Paenibacillus sp. V4I5]
MNNQRAQEIAVSPVMVDVTYNGTPIYIQHVDDKNETARIYPLDQPENEQSVPLSSLVESSQMLEMEDIKMICPLPND